MRSNAVVGDVRLRVDAIAIRLRIRRRLVRASRDRSVDVCRPATSVPTGGARANGPERDDEDEVEKARVRSRAREDAIVVVEV